MATLRLPTYGDELVESGLPVKIEVAFDNVLKVIDKIAEDKRYSSEYKQELIQQERENGMQALEAVSDSVLMRLRNRVADLRKMGNFHKSPPSDEIPQIEYTLKQLRFQWEKERTYEIDPPFILEQWETAIEAGDRVTARVFSEHAAPVIRNFAKTDREKMESLIERTQDMYLTEENKQAREWLVKYEVWLKEAENQDRLAKQRLLSVRFENGKLTDGRNIRLPRGNF